MTIQNPPGWIQALSTHTAAQMRTYLGTTLAGTNASSTSLRPMGGVHPQLGSELAVSQSGSPAMSVDVASGAVAIPGSESSTQGVYFAFNDAAVTLSISAAHASLSRIDIVVVNIRDAQYSGANNDAQLQVVTGTPAGSPSAPAAPNNSTTLAQVLVGPGVTSIVDANITDQRIYLAGVGGVIRCRSEAALALVTSSFIREGQLAWTDDTNKLWLRDGTPAWVEIWPLDWTTWTPTLTNLTVGAGGALTGRYRKVRNTLDFHFKFKFGTGSAVGTSPRFDIPAGLTLHSSYVTLEDTVACKVMLYDSGTANFLGTLRIIDNNTFEIMSLNAAGTTLAEAIVSSAAPHTWATGDVLSVSASGIELA